jgi:hypothetical protein
MGDQTFFANMNFKKILYAPSLISLLVIAAPDLTAQETNSAPPSPTAAVATNAPPDGSAGTNAPTAPATTNAPQASIPALRSGNFDWVQFKNGEWLKGEIKELQDTTFNFKSDELDTLKLDWKDIAGLYSPRQNTILFEDDRSVQGTIRVEGGQVVVVTADGEQTTYAREQLRSIIPGEQTEMNFWSGRLSLGANLRRGNQNQDDFSMYFSLQRRSPGTRGKLDYNGAYGTVEDVKTVDNQRLLLTYDIYVSKALYVRPLSLELYRDEFQNIDYRVKPSAGLGYDLIDRGSLEWSVNGGVGYEYTRYYTVPVGAEESEGTLALLAGTDLYWEATGWLEMGLKYNLTLPTPETQNFNHHAEAYLYIDTWYDLDFEVRLIWDYVNNPVTQADGTTPRKDDFRITLGLGWDF